MEHLLSAPLRLLEKKPGRPAGREEPAWSRWRDAALLELLYGTGLRLGEALGLARKAFHEEGRRTIKVKGKGGKERLVVVGDAVRTAIQKYEEKLPGGLRKEHGPAFLGPRGERLSPRVFQRNLKEYLAEAGLDALAIALHRVAAASPARLIGIGLPDVVGDRRAQNQPGTNQEYPNWRVPMTDASGRPVLIEDVVAEPELLRTLLHAVRDR